MKYLNDIIFENLVNRFKWYPKPFRLNIFCRDKESMDIFEKEIDANELNFDKSKTKKVIKYKGICQEIEICLLDDNAYLCCARRANAVIFDSHFPFDIVENIFLPLATMEPPCGSFPFQRETLEKDLNPEYEIDLED